MSNSVELEEIQEYLSEARIDYSASAIASLIDKLNETADKLIENDSKKVFYDKESGKTISTALAEIGKSLALLKQTPIDLSPLISELVKQNKAILEILNRKPETNDSKYQELLKMTLSVIAKNKEIKMPEIRIPEIRIPDRPLEWEFTSERDKNGNLKTRAKAK